MSDYRTQNQVALVKIETTPGVDAEPTLSDAVYIEDPRTPPELQNTETREVGASLDRRAPSPAGGFRNFSGRVYLKGSGTAGVAPDYAPLLRACGLSVTDHASDVSGTAQAGAAGTITLASGASSTNDLYVGRVIQITSGTGNGQTRIITAYNGTTKVATVRPGWTAITDEVAPDNTSAYAIRKGTLVRAQSDDLPTCTIYRYLRPSSAIDAKLDKIIGAAGNARFTIQPRQAPSIDFELRGQLVDDEDVETPATPTYANKASPPFIGARVFFDNTRVKLSNFSLDLGNETTLEEDPNAQFGYDLAGITSRAIGGNMRLPKTLKSVRDVFASWRQSTEYTLTATWGEVEGNRIALLSNKIVFTGVQDEDVEGFAYDGLPFRVNGEDTGLFLYFW